jgi:large subunit ribosomal protein L5
MIDEVNRAGNIILFIDNVEKISGITSGTEESLDLSEVLANAIADMEKIAGQKPVQTLAKKSVAGFKVREGWPIGCKVTLRGAHMYEFLDRLINVALPRVRDFRGLDPKGFDGMGNYNFGVKEQG